MKRLVINEFEKVVHEDLNDLQKVVHQSLYDKILRPFFQDVDGFIGTSFQPSYVDADTVNLAAGRGFIYDAAQTGYEPKYQAIHSDVVVAATIGAPHASLNRIDLICLGTDEEVTDTENRFVKTGGTGPIALQMVDKVSEQTYVLQVVAGTPNASPSVPATPAGRIAVAQVLVTAAVGVSGAGSVTDVREVLVPAVSTTPYADRFVSPSGNGTDLTLASAIANLPSGGLILVMENITLSATHTMAANTMLIGRGFGTVITMGAGGKIALGANCSMRDISISTAELTGTIVEFTGEYGVIEHVKFAVPAASTTVALKFSASFCHAGQCYFSGVLAPSTGVAYEFPLGYIDNTFQNTAYTV